MICLSGFLGLFFFAPALVATKLRSKSDNFTLLPSIKSEQLLIISLKIFVPIEAIYPIGSIPA